jgi:hypothetical protein
MMDAIGVVASMETASTKYRHLVCRQGTQSTYQYRNCVRGTVSNCHAVEMALLVCDSNAVEEKEQKGAEASGQRCTFEALSRHFRGKDVKAMEVVTKDLFLLTRRMSR